MEKYGVNELRRKYLEFFESKGHLAMMSFSLVPHNDNIFYITGTYTFLTGCHTSAWRNLLSRKIWL